MQYAIAPRFVRIVYALFAALASLLATGTATAGEHPKLLIRSEDIARIRHLSGAAVEDAARPAGEKAGANFTDYRAVRDHFGVETPDELLSGELAAIAFLHLVEAGTTADRIRMKALEAWFRAPDWTSIDLLEAAIALDWCWNSIDADVRREFLTVVRRRLKPLSAADNPLEHRLMREKLGALALAVAVDESDDASSTWGALRLQILSEAARFGDTVFAGYLALRGTAPTIPALAADEESNAALFVELLHAAGNPAAWTQHHATVGRWMEHYAYATRTRPPMPLQFAHDGGIRCVPSPTGEWSELRPLTAHLIATRTRNSAAVAVALDVEREMRASGSPEMAAVWRWIPIVLPITGLTPVEADALPPVRNFGCAVFLRGGAPEDQTLVRIDTGGVYLRRRQHFNAGHFQIFRGEDITGGGDEYVSLEAVPGKNGMQRLGRDRQPFDFDQYASSTIAHNCLIFYEASRPVDWRGRKYRPVGGQRLFEDGTADFLTPAPTHPQRTGQLVALGFQDEIAYAALDLGAAYPSDRLHEYKREFVLLWGRVLLIIDRARPIGARTIGSFVLHLPSRPTVGDVELGAERRIGGSDNDGGIWRYAEASSVEWRSGSNTARLIPLWPPRRGIVISGGPARLLVIPEGPFKGMTYVGGDESSFERLIQPANSSNPENAWFRLGAPSILGPSFGTPPHWGRIEIEHPRGSPVLFINAIILDRARTTKVGLPDAEPVDGQLRITIHSGERSAELRIPADRAIGGNIRVQEPEPLDWVFPQDVVPDSPL